MPIRPTLNLDILPPVESNSSFSLLSNHQAAKERVDEQRPRERSRLAVPGVNLRVFPENGLEPCERSHDLLLRPSREVNSADGVYEERVARERVVRSQHVDSTRSMPGREQDGHL